MGRVNTLVITGYGTNSHVETAYAATQAGADRADIVHFSDITACNCSLDDYDFLIFPGDFSMATILARLRLQACAGAI